MKRVGWMIVWGMEGENEVENWGMGLVVMHSALSMERGMAFERVRRSWLDRPLATSRSVGTGGCRVWKRNDKSYERMVSRAYIEETNP